METVYQAKPMNMGWCVQCHRDPTDRLRPRDQVTKLDWVPSADDPSTIAVFAAAPDLADRAAKAGVSIASKNPDDLAKAYLHKVGDSESTAALRSELGALLKAQYHINPNTDCITCHR
jgi:hypothetical protein